MKEYKKIRVKGIVQGVGFRPFIFRLAGKYSIAGEVFNDTEGVLIRAAGEPENIAAFIDEIIKNHPPLSFVQEILTDSIQPFPEESDPDAFSIGKSITLQNRSTFIAPDTAICDDCLSEFFDKNDRRFHYPFITCTNCGPRFSILNDIPYDRSNTTMSSFQMCHECSGEYKDPLNRRFHTQPDACHVCGPEMSLHKNDGTLISKDIEHIAKRTVELLLSGRILAIKSTGGYHLAADAFSDEALSVLRSGKGRQFKPFALMAGSIKAAKEFLYINEYEEKALLSRERPVVLLKAKKPVSKLVAPSLSYLGLMLPYTPFQHHLFSIMEDMMLVMTSGNISDEPIIFKDEEAFQKLFPIADYIISYNREISAQTDDSVVFFEKDRQHLIRRSRGFVPVPFKSNPAKIHLLATGGDLKSSFGLAKDDVIVLSQYLGDLATPSGNSLYRNTIDHFKRIYDFTPRAVISDIHPGYFTTQFADELEATGLERYKVQHHHAHIAGVLEEHSINEKVIGIAFDGTGYGTDGALWGSEFLIANKYSFERAAHFSYFPLPGGESAIKDVWKIGLSLLHGTFGGDFPLMNKSLKTEMVIETIEKRINSPATCSIGRIFDGISAILGISDTVSTEAEAAMLLEEAALRGSYATMNFDIPVNDSGNAYTIDTNALTEFIVSLIQRKEHTDNIARAFHQYVSVATVKTAKLLRDKYAINKTALSGGVFQNRLLLNLITDGLSEAGFYVFTHQKVPANDSCLALGQIAVVKELMSK